MYVCVPVMYISSHVLVRMHPHVVAYRIFEELYKSF